MGDFTGFTFRGRHSSEYRIVRVSDGDRYSCGLLPDFDNLGVELVGIDMDLYESQRYKQTEFEIKIAYDSFTEGNMRSLKYWLGNKELGEFKFDECPYKSYYVKIASPPQLEYICFDEDDGRGGKRRIYKGEGTITFIAYDPFGYTKDDTTYVDESKGILKTTTDKTKHNWQISNTYQPYIIPEDNITQWNYNILLKDDIAYSEYNKFTHKKTIDGNKIYAAKLYNPGDFSVNFDLLMDLGGAPNGQITIRLYKGDVDLKTISENNDFYTTFSLDLSGLSGSTNIWLDTTTHSLIVYNGGTKNMRYDFVKTNRWPRIAAGGDMAIRIDTNISSASIEAAAIKYNYKFY